MKRRNTRGRASWGCPPFRRTAWSSWRKKRGRALSGFSLTELLVALAILALLAAAAVPLWQRQVQKAHRLDATDTLMRIAVLQERFYFDNGRYAAAAELGQTPPAGLGVTGTERNYYRLQLQTTDSDAAAGFSLTATADPNGPQASDEQCHEFSLDSTGQRTSETASGEDSTTTCWP